MFFNYLPVPFASIEKFASGDNGQVANAQDRFRSIVEKDDYPHKVLVFTRKGWAAFPALEKRRRLDLDRFPKFCCGSYEAKGHTARAFGLRHPQGAKKEVMCRAVQHIVELPCDAL
jgi:hypothetical protein